MLPLTTNRSTSTVPAPSAMRRPISCVRCVTEWPTTPTMPTAASTRATTEKTLSRSMGKRREPVESWTTSSMVWKPDTGQSGKTPRGFLDSRGECGGRVDGADHDGHHRPAGLRVRPEELPLDRHVQALVMHIADDPHHREARPVGPAQPDRSADRIFLGPKGARHRLVDDDRSRRTDGILRRELPPLQDRNAHGPEVVWAGDAVARARHLSGSRRRLSLDLKTPARVSLKGQMPDCANGHNARNSAHMLVEILTKTRQTRRTHVDLFLGDRHSQRKHVLRIQPGIHAQQPRHAFDHQSRARKHHHRQRHFGRHQYMPQAIPPARGGATPAFLEGLVHAGTQRAQGWRDAE